MDGLEILVILLMMVTILPAIFLIATIVGLWRVFTKAGEVGWAAIVPIFNVYILTMITKNSLAAFILLFIPLVNIIVYFKLCLDLTSAFNKGVLFGILTILFPTLGLLIIGFDNSTYRYQHAPLSAQQPPSNKGFVAHDESGGRAAAPKNEVPQLQPEPEDPWVYGKE